MTYLTPIYDPIGDIEPGAPVSASFGAAEDLALFDAYSRAVIGAVDMVGPAVLHLQVSGLKDGAGGAGSGVSRGTGGGTDPARLPRPEK